MESKYKIKATGEITDVLGVRDLRSNEYIQIPQHIVESYEAEAWKTEAEQKAYYEKLVKLMPHERALLIEMLSQKKI